MPPLTIWRLSDAKAGHDAQSLGLLAALERLRPTTILNPPLLNTPTALHSLLLGSAAAWQDFPTPQCVVGAGHATHLSLLAARRIYRSKAVVLMRPSLPLCLFDLCLIPEHDRPALRHNVLATRGVLNRIRPSSTLNPKRGLFLIGGPSAHFAWDSQQLWQQIAALVHAAPAKCWTLTTSRRTPPDFLNAAGRTVPRLRIVRYADTTPEWLPQQLQNTAQVWVSADSVSMVYEALSAGAAVGVLEVPATGASRVQRGLQGLIAAGWVTPYHAYSVEHGLTRPAGSFDEAQRCAAWMVEQWWV